MRKSIALICCLCSLTLEAEQLKVKVSAKSAILINAETGAILYGKEIHQPRSPASITKIATTLYALERKRDSLDEWVTTAQDHVAIMSAETRHANPSKYPPYRLEYGGTMMGIVAGEVHLLRTLLYGMMLSSGNDAANAVACHVSGSIPQFMAELNAFLQENGLQETTLYNPHGLYYPGHLTTAYDIAKLTQLSMKNPTFREIVKTVRYTRPQSNKKPESVMHQHNRLIKPGKFYYPQAIGVKTGYIARAGNTLCAAARHEGRELIAVVLGSDSSPERFEDAIALFKAAFAETRVTRKLFSKEYDTFSQPVKGTKQPLRAALSEDVVIDYYPAEEPELKAFLEWHKVGLPIAQGQVVGEVRLMQREGGVLKSYPLYSAEAIKKTSWLLFLEFCSKARALLFSKVGLILLLISISSIAFVFIKKPRAEGT